MKKKLLAAGLTLAAILAITACGDKTAKEPTTETTTAVEATTTEPTLADSETTEDPTIKNSTEEGEAKSILEEEEENLEEAEPTAQEIELFAKKVQDAVSISDIEALADLCGYPVYVSLKEGEGSEIETKEDFIALGADKIFTDELMSEIATVKPDELEVFGAGVIMGEETNIIFNKVEGQLLITGINIK